MSQFEIIKDELMNNSMETQKAPIVLKEKKKEKVNIPLPKKNSDIPVVHDGPTSFER